jgi:hypothetical protein
VLLIGIFLFVIDFGLSIGPITWLYIPAVVGPSIVPYAVAFNWISASVVIILFPILTDDYLNGNPAFLFIFSTAWCFASCNINYFCIVETKDKT